MSNLNKWYKTAEEKTDLRVISFVSRPKDNIEVEDFSSRKTSFISTMTDEDLVPILKLGLNKVRRMNLAVCMYH